MNSITREARSLLKRPTWAPNQWLSCDPHNHQQRRGIQVKILNGNLERVLAYMKWVMQSSGIERMIKQEQTHHIKNSQKCVLACKNLECKLWSQEFACKLQAVSGQKSQGYVRTSHCSPIYREKTLNFIALLSASFVSYEIAKLSSPV